MLTKQQATEAVREAAVPLLDPCSQPFAGAGSVSASPASFPFPHTSLSRWLGYQLPMWAGSWARRVMTASGTTPSCGGTSLCGISTPRMPTRLAP
jgi:hypothetical protein